MDKRLLKDIERTRIIVAEDMDIPPDDVDMLSIFTCIQRAIEEKVENDLDECILIPANKKEVDAIIGPIGENIISKMFSYEYPFEDCVENYENWYKKNLVSELLRIKLQPFPNGEE